MRFRPNPGPKNPPSGLTTLCAFTSAKWPRCNSFRASIAKRIEAGREAMIAELCESPLTFQAIIGWRDELNDGKVFLRDIIDLDATYAGPDAKTLPTPQIGPDGRRFASTISFFAWSASRSPFCGRCCLP